MALVDFAMPYDQWRGRALSPGGQSGVVTWRSKKGNNVGRSYVKPTNNLTEHQELVRGYLSLASNAWQALTANQVADWNTAAATITRLNALGQSYTLDGIGFYNMINQFRLMNGQSQTTTPATIDSLPAISQTTSATVSGGNLTIVAVATGIADTDFVYARVTNALPSAGRQARLTDLRTISDDYADSIDSPTSGTLTIVLPMEQFTLTATDRIGIQYQTLSDEYYPGQTRFETNFLTV